MNSQSAALSRGRTNLVLATLFLGTFVMGSAELMVVGVLNLIAADLRVSIPAVGALVTANALGLAIGGPLLTALTIARNRRIVLIGSLLGFILANVTPVVTTDYSLFLAARVVAGAAMGLFIAAGFAAGTAIVPAERAGRAISLVISGVAVLTAIGVPLGTLLGHAIGWRGSFAAVVAVAVIALIAVLALAPSVPGSSGGAGSQARHAFAPRVLAILVLTFLIFAAVSSPLTYIVPLLEGVTGISGAQISLYLLAYGAATAVGSFGGGWFADRNAARALVGGTIGLTASLLALSLFGAIAALAALALMAWGVFAMGMAPSLQYRVVSLAGPGGALAHSLPASAANAGIAAGSIVGGVAIGRFSASSAVITGVIIAAIAVPVAWAASFLRPPVVEQEAEPVVEKKTEPAAAPEPIPEAA